MILDRLQRRWLIENVAKNVPGKRKGREDPAENFQSSSVRFGSANEDKIRLWQERDRKGDGAMVMPGQCIFVKF